MLLHEIIKANATLSVSIEMEQIIKYKKMLFTYFSQDGEPILMVTDVFNSCAFAKIVNADELLNIVDSYVNEIENLSDEEKESTRETILFNSLPFKKLLC